MQNYLYAGIGSRETPPDMIKRMASIARRLAELGFVLRSGAADGADSAFEMGCDSVNGAKEIWLPWSGFNHHSDTGFLPAGPHFDTASCLHPAWEKLSRGPRALHARNVGQVLGKDLNSPVSFVIAWTQDGCETESTRTHKTGGTGTAIALASRRGIPVYNLNRPDAMEWIKLHVLALQRRYHLDGEPAWPDEIFVFGSNLAGRHGKGAALEAKKTFGAEEGKGEGRAGNSYAIPTKDGRPGTPPLAHPDATLPLEVIRQHVEEFIRYANDHPEATFYVTRIGCGLAGYANHEIAPLFEMAPRNCRMPEDWKPWLGANAEQFRTYQASNTRCVHVQEQPYDVYIGRKNGELAESIWHNPVPVDGMHSKEEVLGAYLRYVQSRPELLGKLESLRGKTLGCWCKTKTTPDEPCHGDILIALLEGRKWAMPAPAQGALF